MTAEDAWTWFCRGLATIGFGFLLATTGGNAQWGFYLLLIGLFFGPEILKGQISINRKTDDRDK